MGESLVGQGDKLFLFCFTLFMDDKLRLRHQTELVPIKHTLLQAGRIQPFFWERGGWGNR